MDAETVFCKVADKIKDVLNDKILAVNNEKGDQLLSLISDEAWCEGSLDSAIKSYQNFGFSYIDSIEGTPNGPSIIQTISIEIDLIFSQEADFMDYRRLLRYQRALNEAAQETWDKVMKGYDRAEVSILQPIDAKLFNSSYWYKVIGVRLEFSLMI